MLGGRFKATKVEAQSAPSIQKTIALSPLFQAHLAETPKKPLLSEQASSESSPESPPKDPTLEKKEDI